MLTIVAAFCAGIFSGAAIFMTVVQHPAALEAGGGVPGRMFPPMFRRAGVMQVGLALVGSGAGLGAWLLESGPLCLVGAGALFSIVPFSLILVKPLNGPLLDPERDPDTPETIELLKRWDHLHRIRSVAGIAAFAMFLAALAE